MGLVPGSLCLQRRVEVQCIGMMNVFMYPILWDKVPEPVIREIMHWPCHEVACWPCLEVVLLPAEQWIETVQLYRGPTAGAAWIQSRELVVTY